LSWPVSILSIRSRIALVLAVESPAERRRGQVSHALEDRLGHLARKLLPDDGPGQRLEPGSPGAVAQLADPFDNGGQFLIGLLEEANTGVDLFVVRVGGCHILCFNVLIFQLRWPTACCGFPTDMTQITIQQDQLSIVRSLTHDSNRNLTTSNHQTHSPGHA